MNKLLYIGAIAIIGLASCENSNDKKSVNLEQKQGVSVSQFPDAEINVMTFNIRYDNPDDGDNVWANRKDRVADAIKFYDVDLLGAQEVLNHQLKDLMDRLPGYGSLGVGREDGKEKGEYSAIFYNIDRFNPIKDGYFWLSETPDVAGSKGWDGACERIATWAIFHDNMTGKELFMLNTHLDHVGEKARSEGVKLILSKMSQLAEGRPIIITGDFNSSEEDKVIKDMIAGGVVDSRDVAEIVYGPEWTWHEWKGFDYPYKSRIDFIFLKGDVKAQRYGILAESMDGKYLSDHLPVLTVVTLE